MDTYRQTSLAVVRETLQRGQPLKLRVISGSMQPCLRAGDSVIAQSVEVDSLRRGDVVVVLRNDELITHRLIAIRSGLAYIKGDNLYQVDAPIDAHLILGRVTSIDRAGRPIDLQRLRWQRFDRFVGWLGYRHWQVTGHGRSSVVARVLNIPIRILIRSTFYICENF